MYFEMRMTCYDSLCNMTYVWFFVMMCMTRVVKFYMWVTQFLILCVTETRVIPLVCVLQDLCLSQCFCVFSHLMFLCFIREWELWLGSVRYVQGYVTWLVYEWCIFYVYLCMRGVFLMFTFVWLLYFCVLQRTGTVHWVCQRCTRPSVSSPRPTRTPWPSSSSISSGNKPLPHPLHTP